MEKMLLQSLPHPKPATGDDAGNPAHNHPNTPPPACNSVTPDRLKVPKPFRYPERYTSPTDQMMSPVTRGILARSRKGSKLLPPSADQHKIQAMKLQEFQPSSKLKELGAI